MTRCTIKSLALLALVALLGTEAEFSVSHDEGRSASSSSTDASYPLSTERTIATAFPTAEAGFALQQPVAGL